MTLRVRALGSGGILGAEPYPAEERALAAWTCAADGHFLKLSEPELSERQDALCYLCLLPFDPEVVGRGHLERVSSEDHVFPRAAGGRDYSNILLAHRDCNTVKSHRWPYPCEVIYLAAIYAAPFDREVWRAAKRQAILERNDRRRAKIDQANA